MDTFEAIFTRRSVRRFSDKPVSKEIIDQLLRAATSAPSAGNEQPWHFLILTERKWIDKIPTIHPYAQMCLQAPLVILPCADLELKQYEGYWIQDMAAATQNILLSVRALNLGAVWVGLYPSEERVQSLKKLFKLPGNVVPFCIIPIGYTDVKQTAVDRYQEEKVHFNKW
jgi:nitroreductase